MQQRASRAVDGTIIPVKMNNAQSWNPADRFLIPALEEDIGTGDWTSHLLIPPDRTAELAILAQAQGIVCGIPYAQRVFELLDPQVQVVSRKEEGALIQPNDNILHLHGPARALLTGERTALNLLQRLSGIATLTRQFVEQVRDLPAQIVDTRKTTPGLRFFEKYAVRMGGGSNHRIGLYDGIMIKDNHIALFGGEIADAIACARSGAPHTLKIEIECERLEQVVQALSAGADIILLDNMSLDQLRESVQLRGSAPTLLEASGGVNLQTVRAIAETGVDLISVGALTHSAPILQMHMEVIHCAG